MENEKMTVSNAGMELETAVTAGGYCSMAIKSDADRKAIFNATNAPDHQLREAINTPIQLANIYVEPIQFEARDVNGDPTGDMTTCPRIVLFDADGTTYSCCSIGVFNSLKRIVSLFGAPENWEHPITVIPALVSHGKVQVLTIKLG